MTFTAKIKEEISSIENNILENEIILLTYLKYNSKIKNDTIEIVQENAKVARFIYKLIKSKYNIDIKIIVRIQKRFKTQQIYILEIKDKINLIKNDIKKIADKNYLESKEDYTAFLKGLFLATCSVNDPKNSGYHLEFTIKKQVDSLLAKKNLQKLNINCKLLKRENNYMLYLKEAEKISDVLKLLKAINCLFYFEDIRIYRDHKNMVNRLNNCDIANQEKVIKNGLKQIEDIAYLKENDLVRLLDEKSQIIISYREKYPEVSYSELAGIISLETDLTIGKSGINHHFIKIREIIKKHKKSTTK